MMSRDRVQIAKGQTILKDRSGSEWDPDVIESAFANVDRVGAVAACHDVSKTRVAAIFPAGAGM
ncbi:MAG: response regulator RpfG family c-di-GMP phosphodiesterase [Porticoccaceae bacterium]|jgi:response regulator RpfG family c-di-GMP phosphodiesterase